MSAPEDLAQWAAAFLRQYELEDPSVSANHGGPTAPLADACQKYSGVTPEACALLASVDAGGVPAFITTNLLRLARDNGLDVGEKSTPNDIIAALRRIAEASAERG